MAISKEALLREIQRRQIKQEVGEFNFDSFCFDAQKDFFRSEGKRFRIAVCSRRSGKTVGIAADMIDCAKTEKDANILYITQTQGAARNIIWGDLIKIIEDYQLNCKVDNTRLSITFLDTKSKIFLAGAKDRNEVAKFRGYKLRKCYIDEAQSIRPSILVELINDVIIPALRDLRGDLYLTGTPGPVKAGAYYEYSQSPNWHNKSWTAFQNPHMHDPETGMDLNETLAEERIMRGIDENDPSYIRETYGKWVEDEDALVFKFNRNLNTYEELPKEGEWTYILGCDIGWDDADAMCILGYNSWAKRVYLIEEQTRTKQNISDLVKEIKRLKDRYNPIKMVMDAGALGKKIMEEIRSRHGIHMEAADKARKVEFIELLNDDLRTGKFQAYKDSIFQEDCMLVQWDKESKIKNPERPKISDSYHSDICDAVLYAWRECRHFLSAPPERLPEPHTDEYMNMLEKEEAEKMERMQKNPSDFELEQSLEEDMDALQSILDIDDWI